MSLTRPTSALLRVGILLGAFALCVSQLEHVEVTGDEAFSAELAGLADMPRICTQDGRDAIELPTGHLE